jgi:hypothetical protein
VVALKLGGAGEQRRRHLEAERPWRSLPLPDRNLLVLGEEPTSANCKEGLSYIWMFDVREPSNPVSIATFPRPSEADY